MKVADTITEATFIGRENHFTCVVKLSDRNEVVYLPNSGRLDSVLVPGRKVFLSEKTSRHRRTRYDLVAADSNGTVVSVDSRVPGELVYEALVQRALPPFADYSSVRREVPRGRSKLDFFLSSPKSQCFLEVKSVTLVRRGRALFPDAPSERGRRHMESLTWARREGYAAAVVFVIQREDVDSFSPNDVVDAAFGGALRAAHSRGVEVYAYKCKVWPEGIELGSQVRVNL